MRLLHTESLELREFVGLYTPRYAILSHTWGEGEVLFGDVQHGRAALLQCGKAGLAKLLAAADVAKEHNYSYIWIDTCCIDKSSSAELSEAINSMFAWYRDADVCYAYLADFDSTGTAPLSRDNRWFTRGWTLQELIAPKLVDFYDRNWVRFGDRQELAADISRITGIDQLVLIWHPYLRCHAARREPGSPRVISDRLEGEAPMPGCELCRPTLAAVLHSFSVATRMSWAADRLTTRMEDVAYSLLGIFGVHMPLLYGEGSGAFIRLQEEIVRKSTDQSILAFLAASSVSAPRLGSVNAFPTLLATSPSQFSLHTSLLSDDSFGPGTPMALSSAGLEIELFIAPCHRTATIPTLHLGVLRCSIAGDSLCSPAILLRQTQGASPVRTFNRVRTDSLGRGVLFVTATSDKATDLHVESDPTIRRISGIRFDASRLKRERVLLQTGDSEQSFDRPFTPPTSRVRLKGVYPFRSGSLRQVKHYAPLRGRVAILAREAGRQPKLALDRDGYQHATMVLDHVTGGKPVPCGVIAFQFDGFQGGFVVVWGNSSVPDDLMTPVDGGEYVTFRPHWWKEEEVKYMWYTQVYPWDGAQETPGGVSLWPLSDASSVKELLNWCRDTVAPRTNASELVTDSYGSCVRTWEIVGLGITRVKVKTTIAPVEFLGRQVMDIVVTMMSGDEPADGNTRGWFRNW